MRQTGAKIGLIRNPFGFTGKNKLGVDYGVSKLVASTRPIQDGYADNIILSPDGSTAYVDYRGAQGVFAYSVTGLINAANNKTDLTRVPVDVQNVVYG